MRISPLAADVISRNLFKKLPLAANARSCNLILGRENALNTENNYSSVFTKVTHVIYKHGAASVYETIIHTAVQVHTPFDVIHASCWNFPFDLGFNWCIFDQHKHLRGKGAITIIWIWEKCIGGISCFLSAAKL